MDTERWSFKSEAHAGIKLDTIWISKWMELGKGKWKDRVSDLRRLSDMFVAHLEGYDRIFILRCLTPENPIDHHYEMLEIPKHLLKECKGGMFKMMRDSRQDPKPGYCRVSDKQGLIYELYFDGGAERKLQVRKLRRDVCHFHAEWRFKTPEPVASVGLFTLLGFAEDQPVAMLPTCVMRSSIGDRQLDLYGS